MKNSIPLILSVLLGLAAVFAVSRLSSDKGDSANERMVAVTVAASDLTSLDELKEGSLTFVEMPESSAPRGALLWERVAVAYGQRPQRNIDKGDYLMISDIRSRLTLADCAREGEWMIPVTFADTALIPMLTPDDEIAILASYTASGNDLASSLAGATNMTELAALAVAAEKASNKKTVVLLPCVKVLGIASGDGDFRRSSSGSGTSTIFVSLPPQQASVVVAAQQFAELHPVLRRRNDPSARNREAGGMVTGKTFENMTKKLTTVEMPSSPVQR